MNTVLLAFANLVAITVLSFAVYFPRHRRRDLVTAFVAVNIGVLAVTVALSDSAVGVGLGLGLFGVLSIIRLRSTELAQEEIGYYFAALALGLLGGLGGSDIPLALALMVAVVAVVAAVDSRRVLGSYRQQVVVLDRALTDEMAVVTELQHRLGGRVLRAVVQRVDHVDDSTVVDVRYRVKPSTSPVGELERDRVAAQR